MSMREFTFADPTGSTIFVYVWEPAADIPVRGVVQIAHGMAETAARYARFAQVLTSAGYYVYANDHRGHGKTAGGLENVGYLGDDGYHWMVRNMRQLNEMIREQHPGLPVFLFGHSMGSFLSQSYIGQYGETVRGVVLSGSGSDPGLPLRLGIALAKREMNRKGERARSPLLSKMLFGGYNRAFTPVRTEFDWLSRDAAEVDKYVEDPYCGGVFTTNFYYHFFAGMRDTFRRDLTQGVPKPLPIYILSGDKDPVGKNGKGVRKLAEMYRRLGVRDVTLKLYPEGRHEMLNEVNRDEVMADVVAWLNERV